MAELRASGAALRRLASRVSLIVAVGLVVVKLGAWLMTGSVALLASAADALVDTAASLVTFFWVRYAERPPDLEHRFGHGKGEAVAAFTEATLLIGAALILAFQSIERLIYPAALAALDIGIWVTVGSLLAAVGLVAMETWVMRRTASTAIAANRANYLTDIAANAAVLAALGVVRLTGWNAADPVFALAISGYMAFNASHIARDALAQLLDRELPRAERERIKTTARACEGVRAIHDLRTRYAGDRTFVEFHLEVDGSLSVDRGHLICEAAETAIRTLLTGTVEVTAHLEPAGIDDDRLDARVRQQVA
jgi:cation diffusion facilitator family transporter